MSFVTFGIETQSGVSLYRNDFTAENSLEYTKFKINTHTAKFRSIDKPYKIVMYAMFKEKGWSERYEKNI